jgi:ParB family chromosome partitioning protein
MVSLKSLVPYANHPFKPYMGARLNDMVASIAEFGVIQPIIVRFLKETNQYEILSGHNRVNAAKIAGFTKTPVINKGELSDDEARLIVTETNLAQRSFADLSHSERAVCLAEHYAAIKCQGKRNDLIDEIETLMGTCTLIANKKKTLSKIGDKYGISKDTIARYIRLSKLSDLVLWCLDNNDIGLNVAYQLSFIENESLQNQIVARVKSGCKLDIKKAVSLRELYDEGVLNAKDLWKYLDTERPKIKPVTLSGAIIGRFFTVKHSPKEIKEAIVAALQFYADNMAGGDVNES